METSNGHFWKISVKMNNELQVLIESLEKKEHILSEILKASVDQMEIAKSDVFDEGKFDQIFDIKTDLLTRMEGLDRGFDAVFSKVKEELLQNQDLYKDEIRRMQELIGKIIDLGAQIYATENRTKSMMENIIQTKKNDLSKKRMNSKSVFDYYKSNNMLGGIDSMFLDKKS